MEINKTDWALNYLPQQLKDLIDVIGLEAVQKLVEVYGGVRLKFPLSLKPDHPLAKLLGWQTARTLCDHYGASFMDVPKAQSAITEYRNNLIREAHARGATVRELAYRYRLTQRRIWYILGAQAAIDNQLDMFDS